MSLLVIASIKVLNPLSLCQIEAEVTAVRTVVEGLCPLKIVLDRVVLTSTGVLLGCWQVTIKFQHLFFVCVSMCYVELLITACIWLSFVISC